MMDQTTVATEDESFDPETDIVEYDSATLNVDHLYDVRIEAEEIDKPSLAARVEIERRNALAHEHYTPTFTQHELLDIGMMLMSAKQHRYQRGESDRVERIKQVSSAFLAGFDFEEEEVNDE